MASVAISAHGTLFQIGNGSTPNSFGTESFTTVSEVKNITGPQLSRTTLDVTNHQSNGKEKLPGLRDAGAITFDMNLLLKDPTQDYAAGLLNQWANSNILHDFQLVFPTSPTVTWQFIGFVSKFETKEPVDGVLDASITIEISNGMTTLA